jgi:hypothetical protein
VGGEGVMTKKKAPRDQWAVLTELIQDYVDASIAESWKGGGDPVDIPVLEVQLQLALVKLNSHIETMIRGYQ